MSNEKVTNIVCQKLLAAIEGGTIPWRKPWNSCGVKPQSIDGHLYRGLNWFILGMLPYSIPVYLTLNRCNKLGGKIKKGEHGTPVTFWKFSKVKDAEGNERDSAILRYYSVFNIEQCEGIELPKRIVKSLADHAAQKFNPIAQAEAIWENMPNKPSLSFGGDRACYIPKLDAIKLPERDAFTSNEGFYATLFHEAGHSTGHQDRLNRKEVVGVGMFGSMDYSLEELVAEMTSAMLCAEAGIEAPIMENATAYLQSWYSRLSKDPKMLISAASRAQKASEYIIGKVAVGEDEEDTAGAA